MWSFTRPKSKNPRHTLPIPRVQKVLERAEMKCSVLRWVLTGTFKSVFCSHIKSKFRKAQLICWICVWVPRELNTLVIWANKYSLSVTTSNSSVTPLVKIIKDSGRPLCCTWYVIILCLRLFPVHTWHHKSRNIECPPQFQKCLALAIMPLRTAIIHVALLGAASHCLPNFRLQLI